MENVSCWGKTTLSLATHSILNDKFVCIGNLYAFNASHIVEVIFRISKKGMYTAKAFVVGMQNKYFKMNNKILLL